MKKILVALTTACVLSSSAYAASISSVVISDFDNSMVTVNGSVDPNEKSVAITIVPKGTSLSNGNVYTSDTSSVQEGIINGNKFTATFMFKPENGTYTALATGSNPYDFEYISKDDVLKFIEDLGNKAYSGSALYEKLKYYAASAGLDISFVEDTNDEEYLSANMVRHASTIKADGLAGAQSVVELTKNETEFMKKLKSSQTYSTVDNLLNDYAENINLELNAYNKLSNSQKRTVALGLVGKSYKDIEDYKTAFEKLIKQAASSNTNGGGGGGNGGGGGGSSSAGSHTSASTSTNDYAQDLALGDDVGGESARVFDLYVDIADCDWAWDAILALNDKGIMSGIGNNQFAPNEAVTREQFAKLAVVAFNKYNENLDTDFSDVPVGDWSASYVASARQVGFMNGISGELFGYGQNITRQDLCVILYRAAIDAGYTFGNSKTDFTDFDQISDYARTAVGALAGSGIINGMGDGSFAPNATATRAQAAKLVYGVINQ